MITINFLKKQFFILTLLYFLISTNYPWCYATTIKYGNVHWNYNIGIMNSNLSGVKLNNDKSLNSNAMSEFTYNQISKINENEGDSTYTFKDPGTAFTMAFAPGFFVHGLGHLYIGEKKAFRFLLLTEIVSISMYGYGLYLALPSAFGYRNEGNESAGIALGVMGTFLFFWSWIYDFSIAPIKARELNKLHGYSIYLYPDFSADFTSLNFGIAF